MPRFRNNKRTRKHRKGGSGSPAALPKKSRRASPPKRDMDVTISIHGRAAQTQALANVVTSIVARNNGAATVSTNAYRRRNRVDGFNYVLPDKY